MWDWAWEHDQIFYNRRFLFDFRFVSSQTRSLKKVQENRLSFEGVRREIELQFPFFMLSFHFIYIFFSISFLLSLHSRTIKVTIFPSLCSDSWRYKKIRDGFESLNFYTQFYSLYLILEGFFFFWDIYLKEIIFVRCFMFSFLCLWFKYGLMVNIHMFMIMLKLSTCKCRAKICMMAVYMHGLVNVFLLYSMNFIFKENLK